MEEKLYRSKEKKIISGVSGGLGEYLKIDPILVRIIFVIITLINGLGILLYVILWIIVPANPKSITLAENTTVEGVTAEGSAEEGNTLQTESKSTKGRTITGIFLIGLGFIFLIDRFIPHFGFDDVLPFLLVVIGISLLWGSVRK